MGETWGTTNSRTMAPVVGKTSDSASARAVGSATAGVLELVLFHPVDTVAKRLMSNKSSLPYSQIVFKDKAAAPLGTRLLSLFPGLGYAAYYKITQRVYKSVRLRCCHTRNSAALTPVSKTQVWRAALLQRLFEQQLPLVLCRHVWREERQGHHAGDRGLDDGHRRGRLAPS